MPSRIGGALAHGSTWKGMLDGRLHRGPRPLFWGGGRHGDECFRHLDDHALEGCLAYGELARWEKRRPLGPARYLYFWADGIYFQHAGWSTTSNASWSSSKRATSGAARNCWWQSKPTAIARQRPVVARAAARKVSSGAASRSVATSELAVGDGALGFWKALRESHRHDARTALLPPWHKIRHDVLRSSVMPRSPHVGQANGVQGCSRCRTSGVGYSTDHRASERREGVRLASVEAYGDQATTRPSA